MDHAQSSMQLHKYDIEPSFFWTRLDDAADGFPGPVRYPMHIFAGLSLVLARVMSNHHIS